LIRTTEDIIALFRLSSPSTGER